MVSIQKIVTTAKSCPKMHPRKMRPMLRVTGVTI